MESFTRALDKLVDGFPDGGGFPYGIVFSKKFFLHLRENFKFFP